MPYRVTCVVTKLVTEPTASNEQVMEQVMHYLLFGEKKLVTSRMEQVMEQVMSLRSNPAWR